MFMDSNAKIADLFARHKADAVLLHRPYPPFAAAATKSRFGGLPALPSAIDWPRMKDGTPLHFLAQVDCGALPFPGGLPEGGMLFFFGRDDEEQIWDEEFAGDRPWRVIHAPDAAGDDPPRAAPADLPPIGGTYPRPNWRPFLMKGEGAPNVHVEWPVELRRMETWPDASALTEEDWDAEGGAGWRDRLLALVSREKQAEKAEAERALLWEAYDNRLEAKRAEAFYAATGFARPVKPDEPYRGNMETALRLFGADDDADAFPQRWIAVGFFCRALRAGLEAASARAVVADVDAHVAAAETWIAVAEEANAADPLPASDRQAFRQWLRSIERNDVPKRQPVEFRVADWIIAATEAVIRSFAHDRDLARLIPASVYEAMASEFEGTTVWGIQYSQMLGHAPSSQQARMTDDPTVCLLNLASDAGLGWMFGDVGEATYRIEPDALARGDFAAVRASLEGH
ncbi:MAG: hypothetical protein C0520_12765 [Sphingopyxis sp.]|nr:hypothetical protein [Sphingopyxis sp.]